MRPPSALVFVSDEKSQMMCSESYLFCVSPKVTTPAICAITAASMSSIARWFTAAPCLQTVVIRGIRNMVQKRNSRVSTCQDDGLRAALVDVVQYALHLDLSCEIGPSRKVVGRQQRGVINALDLEVGSILFAQFVAQRLADDSALTPVSECSVWNRSHNVPCCPPRWSHEQTQRPLSHSAC